MPEHLTPREVALSAAAVDMLAVRLGELDHYPLGRADFSFYVGFQPYELVRNAIDAVTAQLPIVLHASGRYRNEPLTALRSGMSRLILKVPAVYATDEARVALGTAVSARNLTTNTIRRDVDGGHGFAASMHVRGRTQIFESPPGIANYIFEALDHWPPLDYPAFSDGLIYFLARQHFTREDPTWIPPGIAQGGRVDTDHEWNTRHTVHPLMVLRVAAEYARNLFTPESIHVYSEEEMQYRRELKAAKLALRAAHGQLGTRYSGVQVQ